MKLRYAFKRTIANKSAGADKELKPEVPDGMLKKCNACKAAVFVDEVKKNAYICPHCGNYFRVHARRRIEMLADEGTFEEWDKVMPISNPLSYKGYEEKVKKLQEKTNLDEAIVTGRKCGRKNCQSSGKGNTGTSACSAFCLLRRCQNAGRNCIPDADGKDFRSFKKTQRFRASLYQCPYESNYRWCDSKLCHVGRYYPGRTRCIDWFCRSQSDRTNDPAEAS